MAPELVCWKCGGALDDEPLPLARLAECRACGAELHVCRLCEWFDPRVAKSCREPVAEEVSDKERANFCGYFQPRPGAFTPRDDSEAHQAQDQLESLFGGGVPTGGDSGAAGEGGNSEAEAARRKLEDLFGSGD